MSLPFGRRDLRVVSRGFKAQIKGIKDTERVATDVAINFDRSIRDSVLQELAVYIEEQMEKNIDEGYALSNTTPSGKLKRSIKILPGGGDTIIIQYGDETTPYADIHNRPIGDFTTITPVNAPYLRFPDRRRVSGKGTWRIVRVQMSRRPGRGFADRAVEAGMAKFPRMLRSAIAEYAGLEAGGLFKVTSKGARVYRGGSKSIAQYEREGRVKTRGPRSRRDAWFV